MNRRQSLRTLLAASLFSLGGHRIAAAAGADRHRVVKSKAEWASEPADPAAQTPGAREA